MSIQTKVIWQFFFFAILAISLGIWSSMHLYGIIAVIVSLWSFVYFVNGIGNRFNIIEIVIPLASITWLLMPVIAFEIFNEHNYLARLWVSYMRVDQVQYFSYVLPATIAFILGVLFKFQSYIKDHKDLLVHARYHLKNKEFVTILLILVGTIAYFLQPMVPESIRYIVTSFSNLAYVGLFYALFSDYKYKWWIVGVGFGLLLYNVINTAMYGLFIYMSVLITLMVVTAYKIKTITKYCLLILGIFGIFFIQSIKNDYRDIAWKNKNGEEGSVSSFGQVVGNKISNPSDIFSPVRIWHMTVRANQGQIVSRVMNYVPKHEPYARGETIVKSVAAAFVPRFLWPDKPRTGGADMVCRFLGDCKSAKRGMSYNVGPIGESYINFGTYGGIIFMFFYGLFMKYVYVFSINLCFRNKRLVFWIPVVFLGFVFTMENDILAAINTLTKSAFFVFVLFHSFRMVFRIRL